MTDTNRKQLTAMIAAVVVALVTASSAPWWWPFRQDRTDAVQDAVTVDWNAGRPPAASASDLLPGDPWLEVPLYTTRLGPGDHCNSAGRLLNSAARVVRQDRANQRGAGGTAPVRDTDDRYDGVFDTQKSARQDLEKRLRIPEPDAQTILRRTPKIALYARGESYGVRLLDRGAPFDGTCR